MHYVEHNLNDNKHQDAPPTMLMENLKTKLETKTTLAQGSTKMNLSRPRKNLSNHHEKYEALLNGHDNVSDILKFPQRSRNRQWLYSSLNQAFKMF